MSDKRSVSTDALATLGTIIDASQKRDAIHLAVEPVIAGEPLVAGEHITIRNGEAFRATKGEGRGIVDPFLTTTVTTGARFWFVMYPRMVHSLRHVWSHPAFPDEAGTSATVEDPRIAKAKARIAKMAASLADSGSVEEGHGYGEEVPMTYGRLMAAADRWIKNNDYTSEHGGDSWRGGGFNYAEFWPLYSLVTGRSPPEDEWESFFSCTC
jgi:hypothetical protein